MRLQLPRFGISDCFKHMQSQYCVVLKTSRFYRRRPARLTLSYVGLEISVQSATPVSPK